MRETCDQQEAHSIIHTSPTRHSRKRKRDQIEDTEIDLRPIHIRHGLTLKTTVFTPVKLLHRGDIPFAYLQRPESGHARFLSSIACLEDQSTGGVPITPHVLLVRTSTGRLSVIERVSEGQYVACQLAEHVTVKHLHAAPRLARHNVVKKEVGQKASWWSHSTISTLVEPRHAVWQSLPRLDMVAVSTIAQTKTTTSDELDHSTTQSSHQTQASTKSSTADLGPSTTVVSKDEAIGTFVQQYLELLYRSRTSVAYLAKAHLPRLRASLLECVTADKAGFASFMGGLVLSSNIFDKKHKTVWWSEAEHILPHGNRSSPEAATGTDTKKRRKRKAKIKPDKTGRLPDEVEHFKHWWLNGEDNGPPSETLQARYKRRSLDLRTREAFLQIIIMLELSSIELVPDAPDQHSASAGPAADASLPKKVDYLNALEVLIDKMCIWHSVDSSLFAVSESKDKDASAKKKSDLLRNFCVEVVIPFYLNKTDIAATVNKKLGGPGAPSPVRRKTSHRSDTTKVASRSRKPPQRAPSDTQATSLDGLPKLARSSTDSQLLTGSKRSDSQVSFEAIPLKEQMLAETRRSSLMDKLKLRQREVDFDAMSQAKEAKRKKQADIEDKVKEAINALKKPNRVLASKELADVAEQRELMAQAREKAMRASKARQRQQVQVQSTPKHHRQKDALIAATPQTMHTLNLTQSVSTSATSRIPSSGIRADSYDRSDAAQNADHGVMDTGHRTRFQHVEATPIRSTKTFLVPDLPRDTITQASFEHAHIANVAETPVKSASKSEIRTVFPALSNASPAQNMTTPRKTCGATAHAEGVDPEIAETPRHDRREATEADIDIYAALGWDD